jgi:hypothetical protein
LLSLENGVADNRDHRTDVGHLYSPLLPVTARTGLTFAAGSFANATRGDTFLSLSTARQQKIHAASAAARRGMVSNPRRWVVRPVRNAAATDNV